MHISALLIIAFLVLLSRLSLLAMLIFTQPKSQKNGQKTFFVQICFSSCIIINQWREIQMQYNNIIINNKTVMKVSLRTQIVTVMPEIMELRKVECLFSIAITVHLSIPQMEEGLR